MTKGRLALLLAALWLVQPAWASAAAAEPVFADVAATLETENVDIDPDDPAIWINRADPARSLVIGTDKDVGLVVFDLEGRIVQRLDDGRLNNVDIRQDVMLDGETLTLVAASRRNDDTIALYTVDADGVLSKATPFAFPGAPRKIEDDIYGIGFYHDPAAGRLYVIASFKTGEIMQWQVTRAGPDLALTFARELAVPTQPEGVVADDELGFIYVGEEDGGLWRFAAAPDAAPDGYMVDKVGSQCLPEDDLEGLAIVKNENNTGYILVSAQGVNRYVLYARQPDADGNQPCYGSFRIVTGPTDPVSETDGLDVTTMPLGDAFPQGLMVVQDDRNEGFNRNFKFVSWADVMTAMKLPH
jgi:3-phytase